MIARIGDVASGTKVSSGAVKGEVLRHNDDGTSTVYRNDRGYITTKRVSKETPVRVTSRKKN